MFLFLRRIERDTINKTVNVRITLTLRHVRANIRSVDKQQLLHIVSVCL